jgi:aerobic-type carbon monoxide dehydrogenase small subunit (CoxS/CutS family)
MQISINVNGTDYARDVEARLLLIHFLRDDLGLTGLQCGFCTPGMMLTARWLLDHNPDPSPEEVREALSGQVCRCTGYENIVRSVLWAAKHAEDRGP